MIGRVLEKKKGAVRTVQGVPTRGSVAELDTRGKVGLSDL